MFKYVSILQIESDVEKKMSVLQRFWSNINWDGVLSTIISKAFLFLISSIAFIIIYRIGKILINRSFTKYAQTNFLSETRSLTIKKLIESIFQYTMLFFYVYAILSIIGVPVGSLLAGAGIAGVALGLGAQGFMNDLITGLFIFVERQFDVGDRIKIQGNGIILEGNVVSIGIRSTRIQDFNGSIHYIPNRNIIVVTNFSRSEIKANIDFIISPNIDIELAENLITIVNKQLNKELSTKMTQPSTYVGSFFQSNGQLALRTTIFSNNSETTALVTEFNKHYIEIFQENHLPIPEVSNMINKTI